MDFADSFTNPYYTYHYDKLSCLRDVYFAHVAFAYLVAIFGFAAMVSRLWERAKATHAWFGRLYIISMLWCTATSLLIHNTGLPIAVLWSFLWVLCGMTLGWFAIVVHKGKMRLLVMETLTEKLQDTNGLQGSMLVLTANVQRTIECEKTFSQRFFSLKALHGSLMFVSWINIFGRIFASNQSGDFTCYTYPIYKPLDAIDGLNNKTCDLVPIHDPNYERLPWAKTTITGWALILSVGPLLLSAFVGAVWSFVVTKKETKNRIATL
jgi:hypothetical protein